MIMFRWLGVNQFEPDSGGLEPVSEPGDVDRKRIVLGWEEDRVEVCEAERVGGGVDAWIRATLQ